jgi:hypothetical protein
VRVFTSTDFQGYWPVGRAAVVLASDENDAKRLLADELRSRKLPTDGFTVQEVQTGRRLVLILNDGNY